MPGKLKELHEKGFKLVIFTNQKGIATGKTQAKDIKGKILDLIGELGVPLQAFIAAGDDKWRKPSVAMWEHFVTDFNGGVEVDTKESFYCGDAAGMGFCISFLAFLLFTQLTAHHPLDDDGFFLF